MTRTSSNSSTWTRLGAWLAKPSTQAMFKEHGFVPTRYTFNPLQMG